MSLTKIETISQENLNYQQVARDNVYPERYASPLVQASVVLNLPISEVIRVYNTDSAKAGLDGLG